MLKKMVNVVKVLGNVIITVVIFLIVVVAIHWFETKEAEVKGIEELGDINTYGS